MDIGPVNHEVDFCKVYDMETKEKVERILLKNSISYFVEWEDKGVGGLFFFRKPREKSACIFRIHSDEAVSYTHLHFLSCRWLREYGPFYHARHKCPWGS